MAASFSIHVTDGRLLTVWNIGGNRTSISRFQEATESCDCNPIRRNRLPPVGQIFVCLSQQEGKKSRRSRQVEIARRHLVLFLLCHFPFRLRSSRQETATMPQISGRNAFHRAPEIHLCLPPARRQILHQLTVTSARRITPLSVLVLLLKTPTRETQGG